MKWNILDVKLISMFVMSLIVITSFFSAVVISENSNEFVHMENLVDSSFYQQRLFEENNDPIDLSPHLTSMLEDGDFDVSLQPAGQPIYDESMTAFHEIPLCHTVAKGAGAVVMVIDIPVDYRHDIFAQEGYTSLTADNCYLVNCDYYQSEVNEITKITPYDVETDFKEYFDLSTGYFEETDIYHGTAVAGLVKQVAPEATIISMGVPIWGGGLLAEAHVKALDWAIAYCKAGYELDVITISSWGDSEDPLVNTDFIDKVRTLINIYKVLFTMAVPGIEGINLGESSLYGSMGDEEGVIGVGQVHDEGFFLKGVRGPNGHNHASHPDFMDLELMASGLDITTALPVVDGLTNRITTNIGGTSYATPIVAGAAALLSGIMTEKNPMRIEDLLIDYAIPGKMFDLSYNDADYPLYYGYGILNIVGTLCVGDFDRDGLTDFEEKFPGADTYCTDPFDGDSDDDCISDWQEVNYGIDGYITNPNDDDSDDDRLKDGYEAYYGTNPNSKDTDGDGLDDYYEHFNNLNPLVNDSMNDPDEDGLSNLEEYSLGTNPRDSDTDNDGMPDGWEVTYLLNPLSAGATADSDGDGLKNIDEYFYNCNPRNPDSDGDGLNDKPEIVTYGTDPNDSDTDNDGWSDYYEIYTSGTNPTKADTDGDGIADRTEYYWWINTYWKSSSEAKSYIKINDVDGDYLSDGYEKSHGYNPLVSDMDYDGLLDGLEVYVYHTNPNNDDSDGDGYEDFYELNYGTDPNDSSDYPGSGGGDDDDDDGDIHWIP